MALHCLFLGALGGMRAPLRQETSDLDANSGISYRHLSLYDVNKDLLSESCAWKGWLQVDPQGSNRSHSRDYSTFKSTYNWAAWTYQVKTSGAFGRSYGVSVLGPCTYKSPFKPPASKIWAEAELVRVRHCQDGLNDLVIPHETPKKGRLRAR